MTRALAADAPERAAPAGPRPAGVAAKRWTVPLAGACALVLVAASVEIVLDASQEHSPLIPRQPHIATWLRSLGGERLGYRVCLIALLAFSVAYGVLLALTYARTRTQVRPSDRDGTVAGEDGDEPVAGEAGDGREDGEDGDDGDGGGGDGARAGR